MKWVGFKTNIRKHYQLHALENKLKAYANQILTDGIRPELDRSA